jgi:hypothetical protein
VVNQKRAGFREIGRNPEPRRIGQCEVAVDERRERFGKHGLQRVLHGVMLEQFVTADGGQHIGGVQTE